MLHGALGARILRFHLTPVLEGARARWGERWHEMLAHARDTLRTRVESGRRCRADARDRESSGPRQRRARRARRTARPHAGICLDTGNRFSVGEDPVAFTRRAAHRIRHVHLKDYVAQFTDEGYRLVRCARSATAPCRSRRSPPFSRAGHAARRLDRARRARGTPHPAVHAGLVDWLSAPRRQRARRRCSAGCARGALPDGEDCRTPWEKGEIGRRSMDYELAQMRRSVENVRELGICRG